MITRVDVQSPLKEILFESTEIYIIFPLCCT